MPFNYKVQNEKIVFTRLSSGCGRFAFISVGSLFTIIGVCLILFTDDPEMPTAMIRFIFPGFGLLAIYAGVMYPKVQRTNSPDSITFDNAFGRVEVYQEAAEVKSAHIYYDEIQDLIVKTKKVESTKSRTYYTFHVYILKKDGGEWELMKFNSDAAAQQEIQKLKGLINLNAVPHRVSMHSVPTKKYKISDDHQKTELTWRNKVGYGPLGLLLFSVAFFSILYAIVGTKNFLSDIPVFGYIVGGFILIVFFVVIGGNAIKMFKNARTIYSVVISDWSLDYVERDLSGRIKSSQQFPVKDIHAISFSFDTDNTYRKLYVYTHNQFAEKDAMLKSFSISEIQRMYQFYKSLVSLEMQDLTPVEALYVENYLQQQIRVRSNAVIN